MAVRLNDHLVPINKRSTPTPNNNPSLGPIFGFTRTHKPEDQADGGGNDDETVDTGDDGGEDDPDEVEENSLKPKHIS